MVKPTAADGEVEVPLEVRKRLVVTEQEFHPPETWGLLETLDTF